MMIPIWDFSKRLQTPQWTKKISKISSFFWHHVHPLQGFFFVFPLKESETNPTWNLYLFYLNLFTWKSQQSNIYCFNMTFWVSKKGKEWGEFILKDICWKLINGQIFRSFFTSRQFFYKKEFIDWNKEKIIVISRRKDGQTKKREKSDIY